jgi:hypothetical protein
MLIDQILILIYSLTIFIIAVKNYRYLTIPNHPLINFLSIAYDHHLHLLIKLFAFLTQSFSLGNLSRLMPT